MIAVAVVAVAVAGMMMMMMMAVVYFPKILEFDHPRQDVGLQFERVIVG